MSKQDIEKRLGFAAQGVKAEMAIGSYKQGDRTVTVNGKKYEVLPYQMDFFIKELATLDTPEWRADVVKEYLRRGYIKATASRPGVKAKFAADAKISGEEIVWPSGLKLKIVAHSTLQQKSKAFQDALKEKNSGWVADYQLRGPRGAGYRMDVYSNGQYILTDANSSKAVLRGKLNMSRPGAKAEFADAALNQIRNNAAISDKILTLVSKGLSVPQAIDSVLGEGTYKRIGSEVYDELKKAKASRPGAKAKFEKEYVLWGLPKGETDRLHEKVLSTQAKTPAQMEDVKKRASAAGWHSFRVQILDLSKPYKGFARPTVKAKA